MKQFSSIPATNGNPESKDFPKRILAIRLQAMGDLVITLPYLQSLRNSLPSQTQIHLLTRREVDPIPRALNLFNEIYSIGGGRNVYHQWASLSLLLPRLLWNRYDTVLDLQNNKISRFVRQLIRPARWSGFDRFSPNAAGERTLRTIMAAGFNNISASNHFNVKPQPGLDALLTANGWKGGMLVVLNPAGAFETRNWPLENYCAFARLWTQRFPDAQFLVLGTSFIAGKAQQLKKVMQHSLVNLVAQTTPASAFGLLQKSSFVLSEDSGLMHMGWVSGIPTLALFGGTRSDWSRPLGDHTAFLDAADLVCGGCMQTTCRFGDNHCLTRYSPEMVFETAYALYERTIKLPVL